MVDGEDGRRHLPPVFIAEDERVMTTPKRAPDAGMDHPGRLGPAWRGQMKPGASASSARHISVPHNTTPPSQLDPSFRPPPSSSFSRCDVRRGKGSSSFVRGTRWGQTAAEQTSCRRGVGGSSIPRHVRPLGPVGRPQPVTTSEEDEPAMPSGSG